MCPDSQEGRVELARFHRFKKVIYFGVQLHLDAQIDDTLHLGIENIAWQTVLGDTEAHHPAHEWSGI